MKHLTSLQAKSNGIAYKELFPVFCFLIELDEEQSAPQCLSYELCNVFRTRLIVTDTFLTRRQIQCCQTVFKLSYEYDSMPEGDHLLKLIGDLDMQSIEVIRY